MTASIGESLTLLAQVAGVSLDGLDEDQLDVIGLRLVAECADKGVLGCIERIVDEVRWPEVATVRRHERNARLAVIESHTAEDARVGIYPVPRRPGSPHPHAHRESTASPFDTVSS